MSLLTLTHPQAQKIADYSTPFQSILSPQTCVYDHSLKRLFFGSLYDRVLHVGARYRYTIKTIELCWQASLKCITIFQLFLIRTEGGSLRESHSRSSSCKSISILYCSS
jgi:hypothetical protein